MKLPTLYKKASAGKIQEWTIETEGNVIVTTWGQAGGKLQTTRDEIKEGKNIGKANATTPEQQAEAEAQATWTKKLKRGYLKSSGDAKAGKVDDVIEGGRWPMLAHRFDKYGHKIVWPAYVQPKFDGHRCIAMVDKAGKCTLWTRTRKIIQSVPHINRAIEALGVADCVFDGELYNHKYKDDFEQITKLIKRDTPTEGHEEVQYHIYDMVSDQTFFTRTIIRDAMLKTLAKADCLVRVDTQPVNDEQEAIVAFERYLALGYEGAMLRNRDGLYIEHPTKRSYDLQKIKEFDDFEFKIVGVIEGRGKLAGHGIFKCATEDGGEFEVKMKGDTIALKEFLENPDKFIGRMLTVQYQGFTKKSGVPRFPVGLRLREDL